MDIDDDALMALADGELPEDEAARLRIRIADDPDLAARYALYAQTAELAAEAARADPEAEVSDDLTNKIRALSDDPTTDNVIPLRRPAQRWAPMALAAGLALAVGVSAGLLVAPGPRETGGTLLTADLRDRLGTLPSGAEATLADGRRLTVVASFRDAAGVFCREYETQGSEAKGFIGVACRDGAEWALRFAMATSAGAGGYSPASSLEALDAFYAATGASEPLSAEEERTLLE